MNIDSSNILSMLSAGESVDTIQPLLPSEGTESLEFSDELLKKIQLLQGLDTEDEEVSNLVNKRFSSDSQLHEIADLISSDKIIKDFSSMVGKGLPQQRVVDKEIDLENTLETLVSVLNTLDESEPEIVDVFTQIDSSIETVESIKKQRLPEKIAQLEQIVKKLEDLKLSESNIAKDVEKLSEEVDMAREISSLLRNLKEPKQTDNGVLPLASQDETLLKSKENLSMKQLLAQQNAGFSAKTEVVDDSLPIFQLENKVGENTLDSLFMNEKIQNEQTNSLESKAPELTTERVLPKFATDIANLNRAVLAENKTDIPPMVKHFAHPEWNKEMGERVIWMHKQAIPSAELRLNPGHLGPITIKIDVTQDQATVAFTAQHAAVKEAIESALPKLREMFTAQQLNLAEVNVSQEDAGQKQQRGFSQMGQNSDKGDKQHNIIDNKQAEISMDISDEIEAGRAISSNGLLSVFA